MPGQEAGTDGLPDSQEYRRGKARPAQCAKQAANQTDEGTNSDFAPP